MKLAFLVLTFDDKCLNKKFTLNSQAGKVTLGIPSIFLQYAVLITTKAIKVDSVIGLFFLMSG